MIENQRYMINLFLSNFSEIDFNDYDANTASRDQLIYFGCKHNSVNHTSGAIPISDEEAAKYVTLDDFIHACYKTDEETVSISLKLLKNILIIYLWFSLIVGGFNVDFKNNTIRL